MLGTGVALAVIHWNADTMLSLLPPQFLTYVGVAAAWF